MHDTIRLRTTFFLAIMLALGACGTGFDAQQAGERNAPAVAEPQPSGVQPPPRPASTAVLNDAAAQAVPATVVRESEVMVTGSRIRADGVVPATDVVAFRGATLNEKVPWLPPAENRENYAAFEDNGIRLASETPVSTFSIDVDTGAYSNMRRFLNRGQLPPADAVRTEELLNYFDYAYPRADNGHPFSVYTEIAPSPFQAGRHLVHIGIQADVPAGARPAANLVFLVDVSGSMQGPDKLDLLKTSLKLLTRQLQADDRIALVVYAGASGVVLEPTPGNAHAQIEAALARLQAGGGTNGGAGIEQAYALARQHFIDGGINRILLATDGDFNVGISDFSALKALVERERQSGIALSTLGFGGGNYNDHLLEQLADAGNGNHAYIDTLNEARKVLVDELSATLQTVAADVKIQLEFNPAVVSEYRLIGYENRMLAREDFNNDRVDAGEIGAGHSVTALYEISFVDSGAHSVDPLRYRTQDSTPGASVALANELGWLKLRYKSPGTDSSVLLEQPLVRSAVVDSVDSTTERFRFAAAVAGFGQLLRANQRLGALDHDALLALANAAKGNDPFGYRAEFINLVRTAQALGDN